MRPQACKDVDRLMQEIQDLSQEYKKFSGRLFKIREERRDRLENREKYESNDIDCDFIDTLSDISTVSSRSRTGSKYTGKSTADTVVRNQRRLQKKRESTKEGGKYEDIAIMRHLHLLIGKIYNLRIDVCDLISTLMLVDSTPILYCKRVHNQLLDLHNVIVKGLGVIWAKEIFDTVEGDGNFGLIAAKNNISELGKYIQKLLLISRLYLLLSN